MPGRATAPGFFMRLRQDGENGRAGIVFHCSGMVFHCYLRLGVTLGERFVPVPQAFARPRPPGSLLIPCI
jgi:hypothetical protein